MPMLFLCLGVVGFLRRVGIGSYLLGKGFIMVCVRVRLWIGRTVGWSLACGFLLELYIYIV